MFGGYEYKVVVGIIFGILIFEEFLLNLVFSVEMFLKWGIFGFAYGKVAQPEID